MGAVESLRGYFGIIQEDRLTKYKALGERRRKLHKDVVSTEGIRGS